VRNEPSSGEPCRLLSWDSDFFGFPVASVNAPRLDARLAANVDSWCRKQTVVCLYFLADATDPSTAICAEDHGFHLVDLRLTLSRQSREAKAASLPPGLEISPAGEEDARTLVSIARASHTDSRFFADRGFPREKCADLYETWITRSMQGWADAVLVPRIDGTACGYVTCHLDEGRGRIGLFGVGEGARGRGLAGALVDSALAWFLSRGVDVVEVVTQGRNAAAQRLYQKAGFRTSTLHLWFHKWYRNLPMLGKP
jgi:GNAT superfamily N-acetyltransferase